MLPGKRLARDKNVQVVRRVLGEGFALPSDPVPAPQAVAEEFLDFAERRLDQGSPASDGFDAVWSVLGEVDHLLAFGLRPPYQAIVLGDVVEWSCTVSDGRGDAGLPGEGGVGEALAYMQTRGYTPVQTFDGWRLVGRT